MRTSSAVGSPTWGCKLPEKVRSAPDWTVSGSGAGAGEGGEGKEGTDPSHSRSRRRVHEIGRVLNGGRTGVSRGVKLVVGRAGPVTTQGDIEDEGLRAEHGAIYSGRKEVSERAAKAIATKSAHVMSQVDEAQLAEGSPHSVKAGASLVMSAGIASRVKNQSRFRRRPSASRS